MWTSTLDLKLKRVLFTRLLGLVYPNIYYSSLSPLRVANMPRPMLPATNWVRVRNRLAGICGSDLPLVHANADIRTSVAALPNDKPIYPGHEVVGEVIEIGEDVQHLCVGDRVVLQYNPNCLSSGAKPVCRACTAGSYNLCEYGSLPGPQPVGGGWSEEMLLHEQQLFRLPNEVSDEQGVMLEPTAIALHAVLRHLPQADDNVLIIGTGTIGLLTLHLLHTLVPKARISMCARYPFQIEYAIRLGADHIIYPIDPYAGVQRATHSQLYQGVLGNRTMVGGYDVIYDTVGQRNTLHHALRWLRTHGTLVLSGINMHMMHIDLTPVWHQEINLLGSLSHGRETWPQGTSAGPSTFSVATELIQQNRIRPEQLITHRFALNNYKDALLAIQRKKRSQAIKVLFDYALLPASAVPNVRASARPQRPELFQPQGDAFMEEFLQAQNARGPRQDPVQEAVSQSNSAQQTLPPKILDTPPLQAFPNEPWPSILNTQDINQDDADEDTDPTIPVRRAPYGPRVSSRVVESPQTPIPPAMEPTHASAVETPETGGSEVNSLSAQPTREPQQAEATSEFPPLTDPTSLQFPVELPDNEEVPISSFPEVTDMDALTEEQLPTQTILDNLDADTSSMPEFLAQLSNFGVPNAPAMPLYNAEDPMFSDTSFTAVPVENVESAEAAVSTDESETAVPVENVEAAILPDESETAVPVENAEAAVLPDESETAVLMENTEAAVLPDESETAVPVDSPDGADMIPVTSKLKARRKRKASSLVQTSAASNGGDQGGKKLAEEDLVQESQAEKEAKRTEED
jgi:threonine dehydrogenase-like Zn-dependent dehydrogenase